MGIIRDPYLRDLEYRGFVEGVTLKEETSRKSLCHYFGGLPYGLPPVGPFRWRMPRPLPPCYRYGTRNNPGRFTGGAGVCPQRVLVPQQKPDAQVLWEEDCLQVNIWVPAGDPPVKGWPVLFYIHGGFLQVGTPNEMNPVALLSETDCKAIIVMPAYRLNLFGFLASRELKAASSGEPTGNHGFWDQRLALEWTFKNINYFCGNPGNITVAGYSAGSHSAFKQMAYDLYLPKEKSVIKRVIMWSNGPGMEPKSLPEAQDQFDELLATLHIPLSLPGDKKVELLRQMSARQLLAGAVKMIRHQFRAVVDGVFVRQDLYRDIDSGAFAQRMRERGVHLLTGECADEHFVYGRWHPPANSLSSVAVRLRADYPARACDALVAYYYPNGRLPADSSDWPEAFGKIYADVQIHMLERGFIDKLWAGGAGDHVHRYRIEWRPRCDDGFLPPEWGVTHTSDIPIWFWGNGSGKGLERVEKDIVRRAFLGELSKYLKGETLDWGTQGPKQARRLRKDGQLDIWEDNLWDEGVKVWEVLREVGSTRLDVPETAKL